MLRSAGALGWPGQSKRQTSLEVVRAFRRFASRPTFPPYPQGGARGSTNCAQVFPLYQPVVQPDLGNGATDSRPAGAWSAHHLGGLHSPARLFHGSSA